MLLSESFVGIDGKCLQGCASRGTACHTGFTQLIDGTRLFLGLEILYVHWPAPVVLIILLSVFIFDIRIDANTHTRQIALVSHDAYQRQCQRTGEKDVTLRHATRGEPTFTEQPGTDGVRHRYRYGASIDGTLSRWL